MRASEACAWFASVVVALGGCGTLVVTPDPATDGGGADGGSADAHVSFCDGFRDATLCTDFDVPKDPFTGWRQDVKAGSPPITFATDSSSPPSAMSVAIAPPQQNPLAASRLALDVPLTGTRRIRLAFSVKITPPPMTGADQISLAELYCQTAAGRDGALITVSANDTLGVIAGLNLDTQNQPLATLTARTWTRIVVDARWEDGTIGLVVDDKAAGAPVSLASCQGATTFSLNVGLGTFSGKVASALYDDIVYELNPSK